MRHLWRVGRWSSSSTERGSLEGSVNPARKELGGGKSCGLPRTSYQYVRVFGGETRFAPRSCCLASLCARTSPLARAAPTRPRLRASSGLPQASAALAEELDIEHQVGLVGPIRVAIDVLEPLELTSTHVFG